MSKNIFELAKAANLEGIKELRQQGVDILQVDKDSRNILHYAAMNGHMGLVEALVKDLGFNINVTDANNWTPLFASCVKLQYHVAKLLLKLGASADILAQVDGETNIPSFIIVAENADIDTIEFFITHKATSNVALANGTTAMHLIAMRTDIHANNRLYILKKLIENGATSTKDDQDLTPADYLGNTDLYYKKELNESLKPHGDTNHHDDIPT